MADIKQVVKLLKKALELLSEEEGSGVSMPEPKAVKKLDKAGLIEVAEAFGIDADGKKESVIRALVMTAAQIVHDVDTDDIDKAQASALCAAVGLSPDKKLPTTLEGLKEYFDAAADSSDGEDEEEESEDEDEEESDDEEEEDEDEDESPKKKKKGDDDEDEEEESDDEDEEEESDDEDEEEDEEDEEESPKKKKKKGDDDEDEEEESDDEEEEDSDDEEEESDDDEEEEEVSPKEQKKRVAAYNEVAKKPVKNYAALQKLMVDEDDNAMAWGTPYVKGDTAYCCGLPLKDVKIGGKSMGKCVITGKIYFQDKKGDLVEHKKK